MKKLKYEIFPIRTAVYTNTPAPACGERGVVIGLGVNAADHRKALVANHLNSTQQPGRPRWHVQAVVRLLHQEEKRAAG